MTPSELKNFRGWVMKATDKDAQTLSNWLASQEHEFLYHLAEQPNPYMPIAQLKDIFIQFEAYYWKKAKPWLIFFGVVAVSIVWQIGKLFY